MTRTVKMELSGRRSRPADVPGPPSRSATLQRNSVPTVARARDDDRDAKARDDQLGAILARAVRERTVAAPAVRLLQRQIIDGEGNLVTLDRIAKETDIGTLEAWGAIESWDSDDGPSEEEATAILDRILQLSTPIEIEPPPDLEEALPPPIVVDKLRVDVEKLAGELKGYSSEVAASVLELGLAKVEIGRFFTLCEKEASDPAELLERIRVAAAGDGTAMKAALLTLSKTESVACALRVATGFATLSDRRTIDVKELVALIKAGALRTVKSAYKKESRGTSAAKATFGNGSVFYFEIMGGASKNFVRLRPEWHVHWGARNTPQNPGFKNSEDSKKTGKEYRRVTDVNETNLLKTVLVFG